MFFSIYSSLLMLISTFTNDQLFYLLTLVNALWTNMNINIFMN